MHHGEYPPEVLLLGRHIPHGRMEDPVIQYLGVNKGDREHRHPIVDARDGVPIYR